MLKGVIFNTGAAAAGCRDFIQSLKKAGLLLAAVSSSPLPAVRQALENLGISGCFTALVSGAELPAPTISPELLRSAVKKLGLSEKECLLIETSAAGAEAAQAAGIPCIGFAAPDLQKQDLSRACALMESFESADVSYLRRSHAHALKEPAEIVTTRRLSVREFSKEDFPALFAMCKKPENADCMEEPLSGYIEEEEKHNAYLSFVYPFFDLALWGIYEKETGRLIGRAGFSLSEEGSADYALGYLIDVPYRKKGYARECIPALLSYAEKSGAGSVIARIKKWNTVSLKVLDLCGYPYQVETESEDTVTYRIFL